MARRDWVVHRAVCLDERSYTAEIRFKREVSVPPR
jgi:hypothetical protein